MGPSPWHFDFQCGQMTSFLFSIVFPHGFGFQLAHHFGQGRFSLFSFKPSNALSVFFFIESYPEFLHVLNRMLFQNTLSAILQEAAGNLNFYT